MPNTLPLLIAGILVLAAFAAATGRVLPRWLLDSTTAAGLVGVVVTALYVLEQTRDSRVVAHVGGWQPGEGVTVGVTLVADRAAAGLLVLIGVLALAAFVFTWRYFRDADGAFHALVLGFVGGMVGFVLAGDLFTMFVFFELMGVAAFALTAHRAEEPTPLQGAMAFGLINSLGAYAALLGIGLLYARTGALNLAQMGAELEHLDRPDTLLAVGAALVMTGWLVKSALVPFHFWLADAHATAPAPACAMFSGVMVPLGLYGAARVEVTVFHETLPAASFDHLLLYGGALTAVVGAVMCVQQLHLKRMLALSTVSHVGLFAIGMAGLTPDGVAGAGLYVLGHAGVKAALFLAAGVLLDRYGSVSEAQLHGVARDRRVLGAAWLLAGLALAGLPPFGTWFGKSVVEEAAAAEGVHWVLPLAVLTSALTGAAVLRAGVRIFLGRGQPAPGDDESEDEGRDEDTEVEERLPDRPPLTMVAPVLALLALGLAVGVATPLHAGAVRAAHEFVDGPDYREQVLEAATRAPDAGLEVPGFTALGIGSGLAGVAVAVLLAGAMLRGSTHRSRIAAVVRLPGTALRAVHTGHLGDQALWFVIGLAAVGAVRLALL